MWPPNSSFATKCDARIAGIAHFIKALNVGSGKDTLTFNNNATFEDDVSLGNGNNALSVEGKAQFLKMLNAGSENDIFTFGAAATFEGTVDVGAGNDVFTFGSAATFEGKLDLGTGDNEMTVGGILRMGDIAGGAGNDTITLEGESTIAGEIDLGAGVNSIRIEDSLTADKIKITQGGKTTVYVSLGSTLTGNALTIYSDESAVRDSITLNWSEQTDLNKVRILVSRDPSSFADEQHEFAVELYNQSKSFTLNLQKGYFIQFQAQDEDGWKQRFVDDHVAPDQVTGVNFNGRSLTWSDTHDNLGGNGVKQYHVEVSGDASFSSILQSETVTETTFVPASLPESTVYFRVKAEDYTGNIGAWSTTASGKYDAAAPSRPSGGQSNVNGYSATLSWSASTDSGSGVAHYEYRIATDSSFGQIVTSGMTELCSITVDALKCGTYYWQVRGVDAAGNESDWSLSKNFSTVDMVAPSKPTNLDYGIENKVSVSVIWDGVNDDSLGSGLKEYEVQLANDAAFENIVKTVSVNSAEATLDNLANASYFLRVRAVDNAGNKSDWSKNIVFTIDWDGVLPTVSNVKANITDPTNGSVIVTATFSDDRELAQSLYRIGTTGQWKNYENGVTLSENTTVYFKAVDAAGNESEIASYTVSNIIKHISWLVISAGSSATVFDNIVYDNPTVLSGGKLFISSGGYADKTRLSGGKLFVFSGGSANSTTVNSGGSATISFGGMANNTTVSSDGSVLIFSGGTANNTIVSSGGRLFVNFGGFASKNTVNSSGFLYVSNGGVADNIIVSSGGHLSVSSGGVASGAGIIGTMVVSYGGTAKYVTANYDGKINVVSGGTVFNATANYGGKLNISFGGVANDALANSGGNINVFSGGTANRTGFCSGGYLGVSSGGTANNTTIDADGVFTVYSGGFADKTTVNTGSFFVNPKGLANSITINAGGYMRLLEGTANDVIVNSGARAEMSSGGKLTGRMMIESGATVSAYSGANFNFDISTLAPGAEARINKLSLIANWENAIFTLTVSGSQSNGMYTLAEGATGFSNTITVQNISGSSLGSLTIGNTAKIAGTDYALSLDNGVLAVTIGYVASADTVAPTVSNVKADITTPTKGDVTVTASFSDNVGVTQSLYRIGTTGQWTAYVNGVTVSENTTVYFKAVDAAGNESEVTSYAVTNIEKLPDNVSSGLIISSGQLGIVSANEIYEWTIVLSGGRLYVSGGRTINTNVSGNMYIYKDGMTDNALVNSMGVLHISSGGTANNTTVDYQGELIVFCGGSVENTILNGYGYNGGLATVSSGGTANNTRVISHGQLYVSSGGTANSTAIYSAGYTFVDSGGTVNNAVVNAYGNLAVLAGGLAEETSVNSIGGMSIDSGGTANNTIVNSGGSMHVLGKANNTMVDYCGAMYLNSGGTANSTTVNAYGYLAVSAGGLAEEALINSIGGMSIDSGGTVNNTIVNSGGRIDVYSKGMAHNTIVSSGGQLYVSSGGKLTGRMMIESGATVSAYSGANFNFDISTLAPGAEARINKLSLIANWENAIFTLTVSGSQSNGMYTLAEGATGFSNTITVQNISGSSLGTLTVGNTASINGTDYRLTLDNGALALTIGNVAPADTVAPTVSSVKANITTPTNGSVTVTATFSDNVGVTQALYRIGTTGQWQNYVNGVTVNENATVYFKAVDAAGNESEVVSYAVSNIDKVAPSAPSGLKTLKDEQTVMLIWNASTDNLSGIKEYVVNYTNGSQSFTVKTNNTNYMLNDLPSGSWKWCVQTLDNAGNVSTAMNGKAFTVQLTEPGKPYIACGDRDGNGVSDVMFVWTGNTYIHGYWMNGTSDWWSANAPWVSSDWDNLGNYDMSGDGKADAVMFGNVEVNGNKGAYIGYYQNGDDANGWVNIGYLDNAQNIAWQNKVGNLTGNASGVNSIVWYAPKLYALGVWTDGTENWKTLSGSFGGDAWTLAGCGDFNGDGRDAVLMMYNGCMFYSADIDGTVASLGSAAWYNCEVRAIGDFAGDGKDDIVLFDKNTGGMYMLVDGNADNYQSIGQLDPSDWFIAGCGDYNADGTDDLLVRQYSTGMLGYYSNGSQSKWNVMGYGVGMEWTVIA